MPKIIIKETNPTQVQALVGHIMISGKSGSGKSNACEWIITNFFESGKFKIIDLYDSGRFENMLYGFPEDHPPLISKLKNIANQKPQVFPNQIIVIPGTELRYTSKLSSNMHLMSFNIEDLNLDDLYYLLGKSDKLEGVLAAIANSYGDDLNMKELYEILTEGSLHGKKVKLVVPLAIKGMVIRNIRRWMTSGMFSDSLPKIDFKKILSDTSTITSFSTFLLETQESERMAYGLILKKINDIKRRRKVSNRVMVYVREMSVFFQEGWGMSKKYILEYLRQGRDRGIDIICDMQRAKDIHPTYRRQFGMRFQLRTDFADAEELLDFQGDIPRRYLRKAPTWGAGEGIFVSGTSWEYPVLFPPARHKHKHPTLNVMQLMGDVHGWKEYSPEEVENIMKFDFEELDETYEKEVKSDDYYEGL